MTGPPNRFPHPDLGARKDRTKILDDLSCIRETCKALLARLNHVDTKIDQALQGIEELRKKKARQVYRPRKEQVPSQEGGD